MDIISLGWILWHSLQGTLPGHVTVPVLPDPAPTPASTESLILLNQDLRGHRVIVSGWLACADETYCRLRGRAVLFHDITVEWDLLPFPDRKAMLTCRYAHPCQVTLVGEYGYQYDLQPSSISFDMGSSVNVAPP